MAPLQTPLPRPKALVVEDDAGVRGMLGAALSEDFDVLAVERASDALAACRAQAPDAIVLDLRLPGLGGLEFLRSLQEDPQGRLVPVVVYTAACLSASESDLLDSFPNLHSVLDKFLGVRHLRDAVRRAYAESARHLVQL